MDFTEFSVYSVDILCIFSHSALFHVHQCTESALSDIAEITSFKITASQEDGALNVSVESSKEHDIREKVFYAMSKADLPILHMVSTTMSLEVILLGRPSESHVAVGCEVKEYVLPARGG